MSTETKPFNATPLYIFAALVLIGGVGYVVVNDIKDRKEKEVAKTQAEISKKNEEKKLRIALMAVTLDELIRCRKALSRLNYSNEGIEAFSQAKSDALDAIEKARRWDDITDEDAEKMRSSIRELSQ